MDLNEKLHEEIGEKIKVIEELKKRLEDVKQKQRLRNLRWQIHEAFDDDTFSKQMPYPRLEMRMERLSKDNWYEIHWIYGLVRKNYYDIGNDILYFIPFNCTTSNGGDGTFESRYNKGSLELPRRDSFHIAADSLLLNLPAYIVCREKNICQEIDLSLYTPTVNHNLNEMKSK